MLVLPLNPINPAIEGGWRGTFIAPDRTHPSCCPLGLDALTGLPYDRHPTQKRMEYAMKARESFSFDLGRLERGFGPARPFSCGGAVLFARKEPSSPGHKAALSI